MDALNIQAQRNGILTSSSILLDTLKIFVLMAQQAKLETIDGESRRIDDRRSGYVLINPNSFSVSVTESGVEPRTENGRPEIELYDMVTGTLPKPDVRDDDYHGVSLKSLDPILARSLGTSGTSSLRPTASSIAEQTMTPGFGPTEQLNGRLSRILSDPQSLSSGDGIDRVMLALRESRQTLEEEIANRQSRLEGVDRTIATYQKDFAQTSVVAKSASTAAKAAYYPLHLFGKGLDKTLGWKVFTMPPVSLSDMQTKRIGEAEKEKEYRQSLLRLSSNALQQVDKELVEISRIQTQLANEVDPGMFLRLTGVLRERVKSVTSALDQGLDSGDPQLKKDWEDLRKSVTSGLEDLDKQLGYAEVSLKAAEKATIIAGAIAATTVTGGAATGLMLGVGLGTGASVLQAGGHYVGNAALNGGAKFDLSAEISEIGDDIKDAFCYSIGNGISNSFLTWTGNAALSTGRIVAPGFVRGMEKFGLFQVYPYTMGFVNKAGLSVAFGARGVLGGGARGLLTELPATLYDTYRALGTAELDPSGRLREELGVPEGWLALRAISIRLSTAALGGTIGNSFQGARNSVSRFVSPGTVNAAGFQVANPNIVRRVLARGVNAPITAVDLSADLFSGIKAEAIIGGWFFGREGYARNEDIEQLIVSSLAGHMAGRAQSGSLATLNTRRVNTARANANRYQAAGEQMHQNAGVNNDTTVIAGIGSKNNLNVPRNPRENLHGVHLGESVRRADHEASKVDHQVFGRLAASVDRKLGGDVANRSRRINRELAEHAALNGSAVGLDPVLRRDRKQVFTRLEAEMNERASSLRSLNRPNNTTGQAHADYVARLADHTRRFAAELDGNAGRGIAANTRRLGDRIFDPYGVNRARLNFHDATNTFFNQVANLLDFPGGRQIAGTIRNLVSATAGVGIAAYTIPTASVYGSWGGLASAGYAVSLLGLKGVDVGLRTFFSLPMVINAGLKQLPAPGGVPLGYSQGSSEGVAKLAARSAEGTILLREIDRIELATPGLLPANMRDQVQAQLGRNERLLAQANIRKSGWALFGIPLILDRFTNGRTRADFVPDNIDNILMMRPAENRNRFLQQQTIEEVTNRAEQHFDRSIRNGNANSVRDAGRQVLQDLANVDINLGRVHEASSLLLSQNSPLNEVVRERIRTDATRVIDNRLAAMPATDPARADLLAARQMLNDLVNPVREAITMNNATPAPEVQARVGAALGYSTQIIDSVTDVGYMRHLVSEMRRGVLIGNDQLRNQIRAELLDAMARRLARGDLPPAELADLADLRQELVQDGQITSANFRVTIDGLAQEFRLP